MSSAGSVNRLWARWYCLRTSRRASSAPRLSALFRTTTSAKSSMSIFSSWLAAPYSGRHHVHGQIHQVRDLAVALADAGGLHDHQVVALGLGGGDAGHQGLAGGAVGGGAGGEAAHEDAVPQLRVVEGVHADAVAQQGAAGLALGGVHAEHGDALVREVHQEAAQQLVDEGGLAGAAGAGDAEDGHGCHGAGVVVGMSRQARRARSSVMRRARRWSSAGWCGDRSRSARTMSSIMPWRPMWRPSSGL